MKSQITKLANELLRSSQDQTAMAASFDRSGEHAYAAYALNEAKRMAADGRALLTMAAQYR